MIVTASQSFERSRAQVLASLRDPASIEAVLRGMGAQVTRVAEPPEARWHCHLIWRNLPQSLHLRFTEPQPDAVTALIVDADHASAVLHMTLADMSEGRCRIDAEAQVQAKSLMAKLALRTSGLLRGRAEARLTRLITALGQG